MVSLVTAMQTDGYALAALVLSNVPTAVGLEKAKALGVTTAVVDHLSFGSDKAAFESAMKSCCAVRLIWFASLVSCGFYANLSQNGGRH